MAACTRRSKDSGRHRYLGCAPRFKRSSLWGSCTRCLPHLGTVPCRVSSLASTRRGGPTTPPPSPPTVASVARSAACRKTGRTRRRRPARPRRASSPIGRRRPARCRWASTTSSSPAHRRSHRTWRAFSTSGICRGCARRPTRCWPALPSRSIAPGSKMASDRRGSAWSRPSTQRSRATSAAMCSASTPSKPSSMTSASGTCSCWCGSARTASPASPTRSSSTAKAARSKATGRGRNGRSPSR